MCDLNCATHVKFYESSVIFGVSVSRFNVSCPTSCVLERKRNTHTRFLDFIHSKLSSSYGLSMFVLWFWRSRSLKYFYTVAHQETSFIKTKTILFCINSVHWVQQTKDIQWKRKSNIVTIDILHKQFWILRTKKRESDTNKDFNCDNKILCWAYLYVIIIIRRRYSQNETQHRPKTDEAKECTNFNTNRNDLETSHRTVNIRCKKTRFGAQ